MSSTVLLIMLVVVWLFVLGPLVINSRDQIRRTNDALGQTRLLHRGGTAPKRPRRRPAPLPGEQVDTVDAELAETEQTIDDNFEMVVHSQSQWRREGELIDADEPTVVDHSPGMMSDGTEVIDVDVIEDEEAEAAPADVPVTAGYGIYEDSTDFIFAADEDGQPLHSAAAHAREEEDEVTAGVEAEDTVLAVAEDVTDADDADAEPVMQVEDADGEDVAYAESDLNADYDAEEPAAAELTEEDLAFAKKRRGRGGYDPEADQRTSTTRYQRRQRTLLGLAGFTVLTAIIAIVTPAWMWGLPALGAIITVAYIVALRQVTLQERQLRQRRLQQLRRARMGVESTYQREFDVTPEHLRRPGAVVVEVDDEDPLFDALDEYEQPYGYVDERYYRSA